MKKGRKFWMVFIGASVGILGVMFLFSLPTAHIDHGRRLQAQVIAASIATAAEQFYVEYSSLPGVPSRVTTDTAGGIRLLNVLSGIVPIDGFSENTRKIRFLAIREARSNRGGVIYDSEGKSIVGLFDAWGNPFIVFLDTDLDEVLHLKLGSREKRLEGRRAAVVSPGEDGKLGTADDVRTW